VFLRSLAVRVISPKPSAVHCFRVVATTHPRVAPEPWLGNCRSWWQEEAVPRGGVLVYNTGRSLASFTTLLADKAHCLAHPDALISAVGTKVGSVSWE
jgi:hypothetical protein